MPYRHSTFSDSDSPTPTNKRRARPHFTFLHFTQDPIIPRSDYVSGRRMHIFCVNVCSCSYILSRNLTTSFFGNTNNVKKEVNRSRAKTPLSARPRPFPPFYPQPARPPPIETVSTLVFLHSVSLSTHDFSVALCDFHLARLFKIIPTASLFVRRAWIPTTKLKPGMDYIEAPRIRPLTIHALLQFRFKSLNFCQL